jgi:Tfp pilus assembly protein PilO
MTDKEIIKALECCKKDDCDNCPNNFGNCYANLAGYALDLINRKQAEIERLKEEKLQVVIPLKNCGNSFMVKDAKTIRAEAIKEFAERLNAQFSDMENQLPSDRKIIRINEVKSLMDWILHDITRKVIEKVAKEMTEGQK